MKLLPLIIRNLLRNKRRTLLTLVSVAVSLFIFAALISMPEVVNELLRDRVSSLRLVVSAKASYFYALPQAYATRIRGVPHVETVMAANIFMGYYREPGSQVAGMAVDPGPVNDMWPDFGITSEGAKEFQRSRTGALVGAALLKRYGWRIGDKVTLRGVTYPVDVELTIAGTLTGVGIDYAVIFRRDYLDELLGRPGTANIFWVKVDSTDAIPAVIAAVDETFANSSAETQTQSEFSMAQARVSEYRVLFNVVEVLAFIVIVTIGMVAANTAAMSVRERRSEFAVMRALGFTDAAILAPLVAEGVIIAGVGGALGCATAWGVFKMIPYLSGLGLLAERLLRLSTRVIVLSMLVAALIGIASSLIPAVAALRRNIVEGLRTVG